MKTSRLIFIGYFSIFTLVLASFLALGSDRRSRVQDQIPLEITKNIIQYCRYIKVEKDAHVDVRTSENSEIEFYINKDSIIGELPYSVVGDTLLIRKWRNGRMTVYTPNLVSLVNNHAQVYLYVQQGDLFLSGIDNGKIDIRSTASIGHLVIDAIQGCKIIISSKDIRELSLEIDNSRVKITNPVAKVELLAKNMSDIYLKSGGSLISNCDSTTKLEVRR